MKTISLLVAFVLLTTLPSVHGQTKPRTRPAAKPSSAKPGAEKPVTVKMATTDDGKLVELRSDGTWKYADAAVAVPSKTSIALTPTPQKLSTLSLEAGLVFKSGDIRPVARTTFHLLDESLSKILRDAGVQPRTGGDNSDHGIIFSYGLAAKYGPEANVPSGVQEAINKHVVQSITSDFGGKAKFNPVPQGTYYVFALASTPKGFVIWNVRVELTSAEATVTLDQNNAEIAV